MRFARLIEASDRAAALSAVAAAGRQGFSRAWVLRGDGRVEPAELIGDLVLALPLVVQLDPADDTTLPIDEEWQIALAAGTGWADSLEALIGGRHREAWLICPGVGSVAAAARSGVGALLPEVDDLDATAGLVTEYEDELAAGSARAISAVNAACAYVLELPGDLDSAVGEIERLRQAGVDEVVLFGPAADDPELVPALITEFDDDEVWVASREKAARIAPAVERLRGRAAQPEAAATAPAKEPGRAAKLAERRIDATVRRMSDKQLTATLGSRLGMRALFGSMAGRFRPGSFVGTLEFKLEGRKGAETWTLHCGPDGARAVRESTPDADLHIEAAVADFVRVGLGHVSGPGAVIGGKLNVRGDFALALRLQEMFA
jgi:hypothetical protein